MIHLLNEHSCSEHTPSLLVEALAPWDTFCLGFSLPTCFQEALPSVVSCSCLNSHWVTAPSQYRLHTATFTAPLSDMREVTAEHG